MKVHSKLGSGFLESVYQNALVLELLRCGLKVETQKQLSVFYEGELVGSFVADVLVSDTLVIEIESVQALAKVHEVQLVNYLVATRINEGLLLNFGTHRLEFKKKFRIPKQDPVSF
jgi:GxxExxY protein